MNRLPTKDEKIEAILHARGAVLAYLESIGKTAAFDGFDKDDMCGLIRACSDGVQDGLRKQVADAFGEGEIEL